MEKRVCAALGAPPPTEALEKVLPVGADQVYGAEEPLVSWLRVWDWLPVLPAVALAGWEPALDEV
ncbi:hypothetical protein [Streptomyces sp. NPDC014744]|uniref:hypothetical protein n=1 Tax=Streptomyces sp. NPDC014744 TaxID=3364903 RepID=UPI0036F63CAE